MDATTTEGRAAKIAAVTKVYDNGHVGAAALAEIDALTELALKHLDGLPGRPALEDFAESLVGRKK